MIPVFPFTLTHCMIVTVDGKDQIIPDGRVVIDNGKIVAVGTADEIAIIGEEIDLEGRILMPGLINTHTHSPSTIFRGYADDLPLRVWLEEHLWPAERLTNQKTVLAASRLGYLEYLYGGMTTNVDMWYFANEVFSAAEESGLRSFVCAGIFSFPSPESDASLEDAKKFLARHLPGSNQDSRVQAGLGPHDAFTCTPEILREVSALAKDTGALTTIHISEAPGDNEDIIAQYGMTPAAYLDSCGLFDNPTVCAHGCHLSETDMNILSSHNVHLSYNPVSNMKLCDGVMPYQQLRKHGIGLSFGVDGAQSNNSLNILQDAKIGNLLQKVHSGDPTFFNAREAIHMLTIDAARGLGMDHKIGSIEPGKCADLITLDTDTASFLPLTLIDAQHLYSHIIYSNASVNDVFVDGECLLRDKRPLRVDETDIKMSIRREAEELYRILQLQGTQN